MGLNYGKKKICFFDSGIGGLPLFIKCLHFIPDVDFYYFADNENVPYGNLPTQRILALADNAFEKIRRLHPDVVVIACNTVTAICVNALRDKYPFPIIGIQPAVKPAAASGRKCVVLATPATASSAAVKALIEKYGLGHTEVVACPYLAAYIENHIFELTLENVLPLLPAISADCLVLGCTHYSYIGDIIENYYKIPVYDGLDGTANRLKAVVGKTDHFLKNARKICFFGGDVHKNFEVFHSFFTEFAPKNSGGQKSQKF